MKLTRKTATIAAVVLIPLLIPFLLPQPQGKELSSAPGWQGHKFFPVLVTAPDVYEGWYTYRSDTPWPSYEEQIIVDCKNKTAKDSGLKLFRRNLRYPIQSNREFEDWMRDFCFLIEHEQRNQ